MKINLTNFGLIILSILLLFTGAAAADTAEISPSVSLSFSQAPAGVTFGGETNVVVLTELTPEITAAAKSLSGATVDNVAYGVAITPNGFTATDVTSATIKLPVSPDWSSVHQNIGAVTISGGTATYVPVTLLGINEKDQILFEITIRYLPETILLVSTTAAPAAATVLPTTAVGAVAETAEPEPTPAPTPMPLFGMALGGIAAAVLLRKI